LQDVVEGLRLTENKLAGSPRKAGVAGRYRLDPTAAFPRRGGPMAGACGAIALALHFSVHDLPATMRLTVVL
jgi:hypothetical protein